MANTVQIRIPPELLGEAKVVASALGYKNENDYIREILRQALERDWPKMLAIVSKRAKTLGSKNEKS